VSLPLPRTLALVVLALAAGSAGPRRAPGGAPVPADLEALVVRGDAPRARARVERTLARRPADPWARLAASLLSRRDLAPDAEASHLAALVAGAPGHPLAPLALRRLAELTERSPALAREVDGALAPLAPRLSGLAAYRARVARISAAEARGDHALAVELRRENGAVSAWTLAGPFGLHAAMDLDTAYPPDDGFLPESAPGRLGLPARPTRLLPAPDGTVTLEGEPREAEVFYLAADVTLARGGRAVEALAAATDGRSPRDHLGV
jgi:hypothetical protein